MHLFPKNCRNSIDTLLNTDITRCLELTLLISLAQATMLTFHNHVSNIALAINAFLWRLDKKRYFMTSPTDFVDKLILFPL